MARYARGESYYDRPYREIRVVLHPAYRDLSSRRIEAILEQENIDAGDMENFLSTVGKIGQSVVKALPQVLPAALPVVGTIIGGPVGGVVGKVAGQAVGGLINPAQPPPVPAPAAATPQQTQTPPAIQGGSPAATQLIQTMFNPATLQALFAMLMGAAGAQNVQVGTTNVPVGAFPNLLGKLANEAAAEYHAVASTGSSMAPAYLRDFAGEFRDDPAVPENRAFRLMELLQEARLSEYDDEGYDDEDYDDEADDTWEEYEDECACR